MVSIKIFGALMVLVALMATSVSAIDADIEWVKLDGDKLDEDGTNNVVKRDNEFEVKVKIRANDDIEDAQVEAYLRGYDHDDLIQDISDVFDMDADESEIVELTLKFPGRMDRDEYSLRVRFENRDGDSVVKTFDLDIEADRHAMQVKDVVFNPSNAVVAGRSLLTSVRIKNIGDIEDDEGIKVSISIPQLGIMAADYIDELDDDESTTSEELYLRIPACTPGGAYNAIIKVEYDDGDEVETMTETILVIEDETCNEPDDDEPAKAQPKTIITVGPTTQDVVQGEGGVIYPLTLSNAGSAAKTYVITATGYQEWADVSISPENIVNLQSGEAKALYVYVTAKEDVAAGQRLFNVKVTSGTETLKDFTLSANVLEGEEKESVTQFGSIKRVLEIGLVVLVVLLVILGLIIGFSRLKGNDDDLDDDEGKSETYY